MSQKRVTDPGGELVSPVTGRDNWLRWLTCLNHCLRPEGAIKLLAIIRAPSILDTDNAYGAFNLFSSFSFDPHETPSAWYGVLLSFLLVSLVVVASEEILAAQLGYQKRMLASLCHGRWYQTNLQVSQPSEKSGTSLLNELYRLVPIVGSKEKCPSQSLKICQRPSSTLEYLLHLPPVHMCNYYPPPLQWIHDLATWHQAPPPRKNSPSLVSWLWALCVGHEYSRLI